MSAFVPFRESALTDAQINNRYIYKNIRGVSDQLNNNIFVDDATDKIIAPFANSTVDVANEDTTVYGNRIVSVGGNKVIVVGTRNECDACDSTISIGGTDGVGAPSRVTRCNNTIQLGHGSWYGNAAIDSNSNILIGDECSVENGDENVIISHFPFGVGAGQLVPINDVILISDKTTVGIPADGSLILGGANPVSALPKFQILKDDLVGLTNFAHTAVYNPVDAAAPVSTNGWLRMKYQNHNIRIPVMVDDDALVPP